MKSIECSIHPTEDAWNTQFVMIIDTYFMLYKRWSTCQSMASSMHLETALSMVVNIPGRAAWSMSLHLSDAGRWSRTARRR